MKYLCLLLLFLVSCGEQGIPFNNDGIEVPQLEIFEIPEGLPQLVVPEENPNSIEKWELGKFLFYDKNLSGNQTQSCGSCHNQENAFSDPRALSKGSTGELTPRNSMSLVNVGFNKNYNWGHPNLLTIEQQLPIPIFGEDPVELGVVDQSVVLQRLKDSPYYQKQFALAFPEDATAIRFQNVIFAIATFTRSIISLNSPYDRFTYKDEKDAMSAEAIRGGALFFSKKLECSRCHGGFNFSQSEDDKGRVINSAPFHNTGQFNIGPGDYPSVNQGIFLFSGLPEDMGKFKAPTLRNIAKSGPYMHDGGVKTLEDVIRNYERGGRLTESGPNAGDGAVNPAKSELVHGFTISDTEREDLIAFLNSLTDDAFLSDFRFADPFANLPTGESPFP